MNLSAAKKLLKPLKQLIDVEEARKYNTAEEFVKAQGKPLYHGTDAAIERPTLSHSGRTDEGFLGKGIYLTSTKKMAKVYGKNRIELYVDIKNPLAIEDAMAFGGVNPDKIRNILGLKVNAKPSEVREALIKQGYDGVVVNEITDNGIRKNAEVVALNDSQIKTTSDLTSIWNKAQEEKILKGAAAAIGAGSALAGNNAYASQWKNFKSDEEELQDAYNPLDAAIAFATGGATLTLKAAAAALDPIIDTVSRQIFGE